ncbi:uncharacterized protein [Chlorocebus sabaeus]|uniref:uncharacterized protein n=1 Tax=Chlorocebus sabaeus TaxID=60711 RepID=UPI003BF94A2F
MDTRTFYLVLKPGSGSSSRPQGTYPSTPESRPQQPDKGCSSASSRFSVHAHRSLISSTGPVPRHKATCASSMSQQDSRSRKTASQKTPTLARRYIPLKIEKEAIRVPHSSYIRLGHFLFTEDYKTPAPYSFGADAILGLSLPAPRRSLKQHVAPHRLVLSVGTLLGFESIQEPFSFVLYFSWIFKVYLTKRVTT